MLVLLYRYTGSTGQFEVYTSTLPALKWSTFLEFGHVVEARNYNEILASFLQHIAFSPPNHNGGAKVQTNYYQILLMMQIIARLCASISLLSFISTRNAINAHGRYCKPKFNLQD